jgi:hypothetical protein
MNTAATERILGSLIVVSSVLFILVLALAAYWDRTIRVLHVFEAVPYALAAALAWRRSKTGYALGVASGVFWLWLAGWRVTFVRNGFEMLALSLRTRTLVLPDIVIALPAAVGTATLIVFSLIGYSRLRDKSSRDVVLFGASFLAVAAFFVGIFAAFAPQFLTPLKTLIR